MEKKDCNGKRGLVVNYCLRQQVIINDEMAHKKTPEQSEVSYFDIVKTMPANILHKHNLPDLRNF